VVVDSVGLTLVVGNLVVVVVLILLQKLHDFLHLIIISTLLLSHRPEATF